MQWLTGQAEDGQAGPGQEDGHEGSQVAFEGTQKGWKQSSPELQDVVTGKRGLEEGQPLVSSPLALPFAQLS